MILSGFGITAVYAIIAPFEISDETRISLPPPLPMMNIPGPADLKEIKQISKNLASLVNPPGSDLLPANLMLLGYHKNIHNKMGANQNHSQSGLNDQIHYSISFAFSSGKKRFCIIDGEFYKEQSDIPQGGKILKIESKRVLVSKHGINKWISLDGSIKEIKTGKKRVLNPL